MTPEELEGPDDVLCPSKGMTILHLSKTLEMFTWYVPCYHINRISRTIIPWIISVPGDLCSTIRSTRSPKEKDVVSDKPEELEGPDDVEHPLPEEPDHVQTATRRSVNLQILPTQSPL